MKSIADLMLSNPYFLAIGKMSESFAYFNAITISSGLAVTLPVSSEPSSAAKSLAFLLNMGPLANSPAFPPLANPSIV